MGKSRPISMLTSTSPASSTSQAQEYATLEAVRSSLRARKRRLRAASLARRNQKAQATSASRAEIWHLLGQRSHSPLERLPTEILQDIFLRTLSLNLLRASPYIAARLSSEYVRKQILRRVCSSQPTSVYPTAISTLFPNDKDVAEFQTTLLRQRWINMTFLRHCIPEFLISVLLREFSLRKLRWLSRTGPIVTPQLEPTIRDFVSALFPEPQDDEKPPSTEYYELNMFEWTEEETRRVVHLGIAPQCGLVSIWIGRKGDNDRRPILEQALCFRILDLSPQCRVPDRLLHGPWSVEKCELLDLVVLGNASINWITTTSGETAEEGFRDALMEQNVRAVRALLIRTSDLFKCRSRSFTALPHHNRGVGIIPRQEHLIFAIQQGCRPLVVEALVKAPQSSVNLQDSKVSRLMGFLERGYRERAVWLTRRIEQDWDEKLSLRIQQDQRQDAQRRRPTHPNTAQS